MAPRNSRRDVSSAVIEASPERARRFYWPAFGEAYALTAHLHIASRRVLDGFELAAARLARRDLLIVVRLDPVDPVRPPRARVLFRLVEPGVERARARLAAGPVLIFALARRIDDAGDMARAGQHVFHRPAEELRAEERRLRRGDVVLAGGEVVDRHRHFFQIEMDVGDRHLAGGQGVVEVALAQIER